MCVTMRVVVPKQFWTTIRPPEDLHPILREEVEITVASLKKRKSAGVDNIPTELVQAGGEKMF